jgi:S-methylmethionine-dependent homocysteine/selenocysteine methylase
VAGRLPQLDGGTFVTDGGLETTLIFHYGVDLPCFAAFPLLDSVDGRGLLRNYFDCYFAIAQDRDAGFVLDTPTWRASADWGAKLGYDADGLERVNRDAVEFAEDLRAHHAGIPTVISGAVGPRHDAYTADLAMTAEEAEQYHAPQLRTLASAGAELATAYTLTNVPEAIGLVRAAAAAGLPIAISFTVETDGRLPTGASLEDAIGAVDAATDGTAAYFMINCAHPEHFQTALPKDDAVLRRIRGLRANASRKSHAELDGLDTIDAGDPDDLAASHLDVLAQLPELAVLGGCCGTDDRHVAAICAASDRSSGRQR